MKKNNNRIAKVAKPARKTKSVKKSATKKSTKRLTKTKLAVKKTVKKPTLKTPSVQSDSQYNMVLKHLVKHGSINTMEAIKSYDVLRLGAVVFDLRQGGMNIKTDVHTFTNKSGRKANVAKYILQN